MKNHVVDIIDAGTFFLLLSQKGALGTYNSLEDAKKAAVYWEKGKKKKFASVPTAD